MAYVLKTLIVRRNCEREKDPTPGQAGVQNISLKVTH